jgi:hypothetical protein
MIAGYGFVLGRLRVPTRHCDLVVPADWGWGRGNETFFYGYLPPSPTLTHNRFIDFIKQLSPIFQPW